MALIITDCILAHRKWPDHMTFLLRVRVIKKIYRRPLQKQNQKSWILSHLSESFDVAAGCRWGDWWGWRTPGGLHIEVFGNDICYLCFSFKILSKICCAVSLNQGNRYHPQYFCASQISSSHLHYFYTCCVKIHTDFGTLWFFTIIKSARSVT